MMKNTILVPGETYVIDIGSHLNPFESGKHPLLNNVTMIYIGEDNTHYEESHIFKWKEYVDIYNFRNSIDTYAFTYLICLCALYIDKEHRDIRIHISPKKYTILNHVVMSKL